MTDTPMNAEKRARIAGEIKRAEYQKAMEDASVILGEGREDPIWDILWGEVWISLPSQARDRLSVHDWRKTCRVIRDTAIRQAEAAARKAALEEAATFSERRFSGGSTKVDGYLRDAGDSIARGIRALAEKPQ